MKSDNIVWGMSDNVAPLFLAGQIMIHLLVFTLPFIVLLQGIVNGMQQYNGQPIIFVFVGVLMLLVMKMQYFFPMNEILDLIDYAQYRLKNRDDGNKR